MSDTTTPVVHLRPGTGFLGMLGALLFFSACLSVLLWRYSFPPEEWEGWALQVCCVLFMVGGLFGMVRMLFLPYALTASLEGIAVPRPRRLKGMRHVRWDGIDYLGDPFDMGKLHFFYIGLKDGSRLCVCFRFKTEEDEAELKTLYQLAVASGVAVREDERLIR